MSNETIYYVYAYIRSKDSDTAKAGTPYYIGKGKGARAFQEHRTKTGGVHIPKNKNLIVILEQNLTNVGSLALERRLIKWWGRKDIKTGILLNQTDGGDGRSGSKFTLPEYAKEKIRQSKIGNRNPMFGLTGDKSPCYGQKRSIESREKMRAKKIGQNNNRWGTKHTAETLAKMKKPQPMLTCPHCGMQGGESAMLQNHFDNCKNNPQSQRPVLHIKSLQWIKFDQQLSASDYVDKKQLIFFVYSEGKEILRSSRLGFLEYTKSNNIRQLERNIQRISSIEDIHDRISNDEEITVFSIKTSQL